MREANFKLYTRDNTSEDVYKYFGYINSVKAFCVLNDVFEVFTVAEECSWFSKNKYKLSVKLHWVKTGRECGIKYFESLDDAINYGKDFIKLYFTEEGESNDN